MSEIELLDDLPVGGRDRYKEFWDTLIANPGKWGQYPGVSGSARQVASDHSKHSAYLFEARQVNGIGYIRCVNP
jgi:hypothetical protein